MHDIPKPIQWSMCHLIQARVGVSQGQPLFACNTQTPSGASLPILYIGTRRAVHPQTQSCTESLNPIVNKKTKFCQPLSDLALAYDPHDPDPIFMHTTRQKLVQPTAGPWVSLDIWSCCPSPQLNLLSYHRY